MTCDDCGATAPLCAPCRDQRAAWAMGLARLRGQEWGDRVRRVRPGHAWPGWTSLRVQVRARALVADLAIGDRDLADRLAQACAAAAARTYARPTPRPGSVSFTLGTGA